MPHDLYKIENHRFTDVRFVESPNANERPESEISAVVIHGISLPPNQFGGDSVEKLFTNQLDPEAHPAFLAIHHLRVSAHLFIRRSGECIQYVPFDRRAWHAGVSQWRDDEQLRQGLNDFTIGIELEGTDETPYTGAQYEALSRILQKLMTQYPKITAKRIIGHALIAPLRKTDPGAAFDWAYLRQLMNENLIKTVG